MASAGNHPGDQLGADLMRKNKTVTITAEGRDNGKTFLLTEMSAAQAERWADRAFLCLAHSSVDLPAGVERAGMAGIVGIARLLGHIKFPELAPLMDELLTCAQFVPNPREPSYVRAIDDNADDIAEVATRQQLRAEIMALHTNFSLAAVILNLLAAASELKAIPMDESTLTSP